MRNWWRRILGRQLARLRHDGLAGVLWSLRITVAAVASYIVGIVLFPGTQPLLAPLTAMLVVQVTPVSLLASGLDRVVSVVAGVLVAVAFSAVAPLQWWSLGVLILISITIGQVLRLRANLIEVAISGMLVLGVGSMAAGSAAWQRITETLVGAAVGVAANLLFPPKVASEDAGRAIDGLADSMSELLRRAADDLTDAVAADRDVWPVTPDWLDEARRITRDIPRIAAALAHAEQGRRLNVRAVGTSDVGPGLRQGLEALEHASVAIRSMFRAVVDATGNETWRHDECAPDVLLGLALTFRELAAGVDAFGELVRHEAERPGRLSATEVQDLREALEGLNEARARLDDLVVAGGSPSMIELHAAMLSTVKRVQAEMDLDERVRRQVRMLPRARPRTAAEAAGRPFPPLGPPEPSPDADTQGLPAVPPLRRRGPGR